MPYVSNTIDALGISGSPALPADPGRQEVPTNPEASSSREATNPATAKENCVFCGIFAADMPEEETFIVSRENGVVVILNAYPYASGHLLVMPERHVADVEDLTDEEGIHLTLNLKRSIVALRRAYSPQGLNVGANLGTAAGAGIPGHFHAHALPRWNGDTNFMTTVAGVRVLPEALGDSWKRIRDAWQGQSI